MGLLPDGAESGGLEEVKSATDTAASGTATAVRSANFWLILVGSTLVVGAIGAVIQHFIFFLTDQGFSPAAASRFSTALLAASLGGRVFVGYIADHFRKKNTMALFYALLSASLLLLGTAHQTIAVWTFALFFGSPWARTTC